MLTAGQATSLDQAVVNLHKIIIVSEYQSSKNMKKHSSNENVSNRKLKYFQPKRQHKRFNRIENKKRLSHNILLSQSLTWRYFGWIPQSTSWKLLQVHPLYLVKHSNEVPLNHWSVRYPMSVLSWENEIKECQSVQTFTFARMYMTILNTVAFIREMLVILQETVFSLSNPGIIKQVITNQLPCLQHSQLLFRQQICYCFITLLYKVKIHFI